MCRILHKGQHDRVCRCLDNGVARQAEGPLVKVVTARKLDGVVLLCQSVYAACKLLLAM